MADSRKRRNCLGHANSVEFAMGFFIFFLILLFPLINMIGFVLGAATQYFLTVQSVSSAATSINFGDALLAMEKKSKEFANSGFGQFAKLKPISGFGASGTDLFVDVTPYGGVTPTGVYGPNSPYAGVLDKDQNIYEYRVKSVFDVGPFVSMANVPFIGSVPGLGVPARLTFSASQVVEFVDGLSYGGSALQSGSGPIASLPPGSPGSTSSPPSGSSAPTGIPITLNGIPYTPADLRWWGKHPFDTEWNNQPNPLQNNDPSTLSNGQPNPYYPP